MYTPALSSVLSLQHFILFSTFTNIQKNSFNCHDTKKFFTHTRQSHTSVLFICMKSSAFWSLVVTWCFCAKPRLQLTKCISCFLLPQLLQEVWNTFCNFIISKHNCFLYTGKCFHAFSPQFANQFECILQNVFGRPSTAGKLICFGVPLEKFPSSSQVIWNLWSL